MNTHPPAARALAVIALASTAAIAMPAAAQSLEVAPISIDLAPKRAASVLTLTNRGEATKTFQIRAFVWDQTGDAYHLVPTQDLLVSPPFTTLKSGDKQTVRVVLRRPATVKEDSYRLLIDEIPSAASAGTVQVALRISLPVFAQPPVEVKPDLAWRFVRSGASELTLVIRNSGARHARLSGLTLTAPGVTMRLPAGSMAYVLPGSEIRLAVAVTGPLAATQATIKIHAMSDQGIVQLDAPVSSHP